MFQINLNYENEYFLSWMIFYFILLFIRTSIDLFHFVLLQNIHEIFVYIDYTRDISHFY